MRHWATLLLTCLTLGVLSTATAQDTFVPITPETASQVNLLAALGNGPVDNLAWSDDGETLSVLFGDTVWLYQVTDTLERLRQEPAGIVAFPVTWKSAESFSPPSGTIQIDALGVTLEGHSAEVQQVTLSPDETFLVSASDDKTVRFWSASDGTPIAVLEGSISQVMTVAVHPDNDTVIAGSVDGRLLVWSASQPEAEPHMLTNLHRMITHLQFNPAGDRLAVGTLDGSVWVLDPQTGEVIASETIYTSIIWDGAFSPDGSLFVTGNDDNQVILYDVLAEAPYLQPRVVLEGHQGPVYSVIFSQDGQSVISGSSDGTVRVWSVETGEQVQTLQTDPHAQVLEVDLNPVTHTLICTTSRGFYLGGLSGGGVCSLPYQGEEERFVLSYAAHPDGEHYARWTLENELEVGQYSGNQHYPAQSLYVSNRGGLGFTSETYFGPRAHLIFSSDGAVLLDTDWQAYQYHNGLVEPLVLEDIEGRNYPSAFTSDGRYLFNGWFEMWEASTGRLVFGFPMDEGAAVRDPQSQPFAYGAPLMSPDQRLVVAGLGSSHAITVWGVIPAPR